MYKVAWSFARRYIFEWRTLTIDTEIPVGIIKGGLRTPAPNVPCILVGPGTGVAPMRAVIEQRVFEGTNGTVLYNYFQL